MRLNPSTPAATVLLVLIALAPAAFGQEQPAGHDMTHRAPGAEATGPAVAAYDAAMEQMMQEMAAPATGNPDVDFARGMIAHHRGAVAMSEVELEYGADTELRALAEQIIKAQKPEIALMQQWLEKKGH